MKSYPKWRDFRPLQICLESNLKSFLKIVSQLSLAIIMTVKKKKITYSIFLSPESTFILVKSPLVETLAISFT